MRRRQPQGAESVNLLLPIRDRSQHRAEDHQTAQQHGEQQIADAAGGHHRAQHVAIHTVRSRRHNRRAIHHAGKILCQPGRALRILGVKMNDANLAAGPEAKGVFHDHHGVGRQIRPVGLLGQQVIGGPYRLAGLRLLHLRIINRDDAGVVHVGNARKPGRAQQRTHRQRDSLNDYLIAGLHAQQGGHGIGHVDVRAKFFRILNLQEVAQVRTVSQLRHLKTQNSFQGHRVGPIGAADHKIGIARKLRTHPMPGRHIRLAIPAGPHQLDIIRINGAPRRRVIQHARIVRRGRREQPDNAALRIEGSEH